MTLQHADIEHLVRSGEHACDGHRQDMLVHPNHASVLAPPQPGARNPSCKLARADKLAGAARLTGDLRTGGRTTRSPLHGCLPPPSKGGSRGLGRGRAPPQHTILRWNQQLPTRVYLLSEHIRVWACR